MDEIPGRQEGLESAGEPRPVGYDRFYESDGGPVILATVPFAQAGAADCIGGGYASQNRVAGRHVVGGAGGIAADQLGYLEVASRDPGSVDSFGVTA